MDMLKQSREQMRALNSLQKAGRVMLQEKPLGELLYEMAILTQDMIQDDADEADSSFSYIALLENDRLNFKAASPARMMPILLERMGNLSTSRGVVGKVMRDQARYTVPDVSEDDYYIQLEEGVKAQVALPLMIRDEIVGVLSIEHNERDPFSPEMLEHLDVLAGMIAGAIETAHQRAILEEERLRREKKLSTQTIRFKLTGLTQQLEKESKAASRSRKIQSITLSVIKIFSEFSNLADASQPLESFWQTLRQVLPEICKSVGAEAGAVLHQINNSTAFEIRTQFPPMYSSENTFYTFSNPSWDEIINVSGGLQHTTIQKFNAQFSARMPFQDWGFVDTEQTEIVLFLIDGHTENSRIILMLANHKLQPDMENDLWFEEQIDIFSLIALRLREIYTATLQSEAQLKHEKDRQMFIQDVMHQLVGPLASLKGDAETLLHDLIPADAIEERRDTLKRMVEQASLFQGYAMSFSLAAQNTSILNISEKTFKVFDSEALINILERHTHSFRGQAIYNQIDGPKVLKDTFAHFPELSINEEYFGILLLNMYDNAVKYSLQGMDAPIEVSGRTNKWSVEILITNHGVEIPARDVQRIFERYARTDSAQEFQPVGTGIGLYLCDKIMKLHGGSISVEPSKPSKRIDGAHEITFFLRLPIGGERY
ncbi:MAG: GAF domain-containing sensor histidine kinase [Aggregatilineales bacterium]